MAKFITSIELQQAEQKDYSNLTTAMSKAFFIAVNSPNTGGRAVFRYNGGKTIVDVINAVARVIKATGKSYSFTVMKDKNFRQPANQYL